MIVNPQLFNYRLIKGSLVIVVAVFGVLGYLKYQSIEAQNVFLQQENKLIVNELSQVLNQNEVISNENEQLVTQLETFQETNIAALDSITKLTQNLSVMSKYKTENLGLKDQLISSTYKLKKATNALHTVEQNYDQSVAQLKAQTAEISRLKDGSTSLLNLANTSYNLTANYIAVKGYETILNSRVFTTKAKKVNNIEVCFNLAADENIKAGSKVIYVQILNPENNVVADKGMVTFNEQTLIYSYKTTVEYINKHTTVCTAIEADRDDKPLKKGSYRINVFNEDHLIGSTALNLE
ncbi:hypothetical protein [Paucihalobacter sp.]